ncbi:MAG: amidohydrolase [Verrucomicrobia bacterium]|nr:amidohydrolase [Verrucomicrobiota bacterium]
MHALIDSLESPSREAIFSFALAFEEYTIKTRRALHQIPELGWEEEKTLATILKEIQKAAKNSIYTINIVHKEGGIWVDLLVDPSLPHLLFRSDIDALPIEEETNLPFSSKHPGKMHACGHDCHAAILLTAFTILAKNLLAPRANIRFVWQRAEEYNLCRSGGEKLLEEGVVEGIDHAYGLHINPTTSIGTFFSKPGRMMANSSQINCTIECSGGHVMYPDRGSNAIYIMIDIQNSLRGLEGIYFKPTEPIVFVPSIAQAGVASNVRPNRAELTFALRNFLPEEERDHFVSIIKEKIHAITATYPTALVSRFSFIPGYPSLTTDPENFYFVQDLLLKNGLVASETPPLFCGEDFAYYLQKVPGSFWCFGTKQEGETYDLHTSKCNPNEKALKLGVFFWLLLSQNLPSKRL